MVPWRGGGGWAVAEAPVGLSSQTPWGYVFSTKRIPPIIIIKMSIWKILLILECLRASVYVALKISAKNIKTAIFLTVALLRCQVSAMPFACDIAISVFADVLTPLRCL